MKVLYLQPGPGIGGAKISLYHLLLGAPQDQESQVALSSPPEPKSFMNRMKSEIGEIRNGVDKNSKKSLQILMPSLE